MNIPKLESLLDSDQQAIKDFKAGAITAEELERINRENKAFLLESIAVHGFPFKDVASAKAYEAAFLVIQHSCDLELMDRTIATFSTASESQISRRHPGYLIDRARILRNLPQVYGTQYRILQNGSVEFLPIEDREGLEQRRAELGMGSFGDYEKRASDI